MGNLVKLSQENTEILRSIGSTEYATHITALKAFAQALTEPLRQGIFDEDNLKSSKGRIFAPAVLAPGALANFQLDFVRPGTEDIDFTAFTLPKQGRVPERHVEGDELWVPTFRVGNAIDWDLRYARDARWDIVARAVEVYKKGFIRKINEDGWHTILAAADSRGLVVNDSVAAPGQFTKELISRMLTAMTRNAGGNGQSGRLTDLYLSMEAVEDVRAWDISEIDDVTRREILTSAGSNMMRLYGVVLHPMTEFGVGQEYQLYMTSVLGRTVTGVDATDQEFVVGLDMTTNDSFVNPIREQLSTHEDPALHRHQRAGIYGWMEHGFAILDNRRLMLGTF